MKTWIREHAGTLVASVLLLGLAVWAIAGVITHQGNKDIEQIEKAFAEVGEGRSHAAWSSGDGDFSQWVSPTSAAELVSVRQAGRRTYRVTYRVAGQEHVTSVRASGQPARIDGLGVRVTVEAPDLETPVTLSQRAVYGTTYLFPGEYRIEGFRREWPDPGAPLVALDPDELVVAHQGDEAISVRAEPRVSAVGEDMAERAVVDHVIELCPAHDLHCPELPGGDAARVSSAELIEWEISDAAVGHYGGMATLEVTTGDPASPRSERRGEPVEMEIYVDLRGKDVAVLAE